MTRWPVLHMQFPRAITALHQIEITSRCNLRCVYCPQRDIADGKYAHRAAMDMTTETFQRALHWVGRFVRQKTQHELNLAGVGESTLHPRFVEFLAMAREVVGTTRIVFATNGLLASEELVAAMAPYQPRVWVSLHRPEKAGLALDVYKRHGLLEGVSLDPAVNANDWAGQVDWKRTGEEMPCQWLREGKAFVLADGRIGTCCIDASGAGVVGHVADESLPRLQPYALCSTCYQHIDVRGYDQFGERP